MSWLALVKVEALLALFLLPEILAFAPLTNVKTFNKGSIRYSTSGQNDPYELQYRQYFQAQTKVSTSTTTDPPSSSSYGSENNVVNETYDAGYQQNRNGAVMQQQQQQQQPQQQTSYTTMATAVPAPPTTTDPYELQYQKYFQSQTTARPAIETTAQPVNPPTVGGSSMMDSPPTYYTPPAEYQSGNSAATSVPAAESSFTYYTPPVDYQNGNSVENSVPATESSVTYYTPPVNYQNGNSAAASVPGTTMQPSSAGDSAVASDNGSTYFPPVETEKVMNVARDMAPNAAMEAPSEQQQEEELTPEQLQALEDKYLHMVSSEFQYKKFLGQNPYALTDIPFDVIFSRLLDTVEDSAIARKNKKARPQDIKADRKTIVVLGSGWGAHAFVKMASTMDLKIIVVSPVNHFVFTPMLASAAVGTVEYRSMTEPIRVTNPNIENYIEGRAIGIDVQNKFVTVRLTSDGISSSGKINNYSNDSSNIIQLPYDHLICSVGTKVRSSMVPGAVEHCFNLKTAQDSKKLRTAVQEALESACRADVEGWGELTDQKRWRRVAFVIIGGGPTGVELAGELNDFLLDICQPRGPYSRLLNDFSITLIHGGSDLLPQFDKPLRKRALHALEERGVQVRLNTRVQEVGKKYVILKEKGGDEEEIIPAGVIVWAAGNEPVPFVKDLLSQLPEEAVGTAGRVKVDRWLRAPTHTPETFGSIFVIGDAADLAPNPNDPKSSLPQTAQVAGQQGAFMARLLNRGYEVDRTPPKLPEYDSLSPLRIWLLVRGMEEAPDFVFLNLGLLAYVGGGEALTQVQAGDVPIVGLAGKGAFALWRSVYLAKQASMRNRSQLIFDWAKSQSYGRDLTRL